ncbi:hypothetical protein ACF0H5_024238 [Mactra antiquata]
MAPNMLRSLVFLLGCVYLTNGQISGGTILDVLSSTNGLKMFGSWCQETMPGLYSGNGVLTVFAFNDTSFNTMSSDIRARLNSLTSEEKMDYVQTYTLRSKVTVDQLHDSSTTTGLNGKKLFINKRSRTYWMNPSTTTGTTATFINGAMIIREQIQASNGIIHVLDRALDVVSDKNVYQWLNAPTDPGVQTSLWSELAKRLFQDSRYYLDVVSPIASADRVTFFLPSEKSLRKIPPSKLQSLQGEELANYFKQHYILNRVVFTSYLEHQENYESAYPGSRILFMRQDANRVLVKSGGVTAMIEQGNITTRNGVIHIIDRMFGYVYNSAREQIAIDAPRFNSLIDRVSPELQSLITQPTGVNLFVPTDAAFQYVQNLRGVSFETNSTLIDYVVRLCMLRDSSIEVSSINGNYDVRQRRYTRYNNFKLVIYNDRNESWVNGGNVRSRIIRPDIKVTTGALQYIDGILGVPDKDIATLIYYDEYLVYTYNDLQMTRLIDYLRDPGFDSSSLPPRSFHAYSQGFNNFASMNNFNLYTTMYPNQYPTQFPNQVTQYPNNLPYDEYMRRQQQGGGQYPNNQFSNNQYPNTNQYPNNNNQYPNTNQYPNNNNQYPNNNNQYPNNNNQYPNNNQYQGNNQYAGKGNYCGSINNVCQFTFFVPNGTAIYNYYMTSIGNRITKDVDRYAFIFRRLMVPNKLIFLENLPVSPQSYRYRTHSGEEISLKKETENIVRLYWGGQAARLIMWDMGATNGVVHIIDTVLSNMDDLDRDISGSSAISCNLCLVGIICATLSYLLSFKHL